MTREAKYWIASSAVISFLCALFQVISVRLFSFIFPVSMLFLLSLVTAFSILFLGVGISISRLKWIRYKVVSICSGIISCVLLLSLFLLRHVDVNAVTPYMAVSLLVVAFPMILFGILTGTFYTKTASIDKMSLKWLIAANAICFFAGFVSTNELLQWHGVTPILFILLTGPLIVSSRKILIPGVLLMMMSLPFIHDGSHFPKYADFVKLWSHFEAEQYLAGAWSPYSRIDFVEFQGGKLAGVYNGKQQWMVSPNPQEDFDFRRIAYENVAGHVLAIGTGGGQGLLSLRNAAAITAVELDPVVVEFLSGGLSKYNDNVYGRVDTYAGEGRAYLEQTNRRFDVIIYEGTDFAVGLSDRLFFSMEHYLYTTEGVKETFRHLNEDGVLIALHTRSGSSTSGLLRNLPSGTFYGVWEGVAKGTIRFPFIFMVASRNREKIEGWRKYLSTHLPGLSETTTTRFSDGVIQARTVVTDERPLLFFEATTQLVPLLSLFGASCLLTGLFIAFSRKIIVSSLFLLIGTSYILVELFVINKYRAWLGGFIETTAVSLGFLAMSGALGNIFYKKIGFRWSMVGMAASFFVLMVMTVHLPYLPLLSKLLYISISISPVGFFMGTVFPRAFETADHNSVFKLLAIDTLSAATGFLLFYLCIILLGLKLPIVIAGVSYLMSLVLIRKMASF